MFDVKAFDGLLAKRALSLVERGQRFFDIVCFVSAVINVFADVCACLDEFVSTLVR
jgi:hypothetical protein